jgi:putative transposase
LPADRQALWEEARGLVSLKGGVLMIDDSTLDKPYANQIERVTRHWRGKHPAVVQGINLESLVWSDGERIVPVDCRLYAKAQDQQTKHDHAWAMVTTAKERGFEPDVVMFDSSRLKIRKHGTLDDRQDFQPRRYASLANLKHLRVQNWFWLCRLKGNRLVDPDNTGKRAIAELDIPEQGLQVHLKGYGVVKVFRTVTHTVTRNTGQRADSS